MKQNKKHTIFFLLFVSLLILYGCDKPAPTQLLPEDPMFDEQVEIEVISGNLNDEAVLGGVDTTGITDDLFRFSNVISVSGVKFTHQNSTQYSSIAQAVFFDKSQPIILHGEIIGYRTLTPGNVRFNGFAASKIPLRKRIRRGGATDSVNFGSFYSAFGRNGMGEGFEFPYNSNVDFELEILGADLLSFSIPTPPELLSQFQIAGRRSAGNLAVRLNWDAYGQSKFEVVISGRKRGENINIPLYRLRTKDDGAIIIPPKLLNSIPAERFNGIIITLVRKFTGSREFRNSELFVSSQSIHSIQIDFN